MGNWIRFFFSTPRRFVATLVAMIILLGIEHFFPGAVGRTFILLGDDVLGAIVRLLKRFLGPIAISLLPLIIAGVGIRIIIKGFGSGHRRR